MRTRLIRVGNSRGVRLPKPLIDQAGLVEEVELRVSKGAIILSKPENPREGWAAAAADLAANGIEEPVDAPTPTRFDEEEWKW